MFKKSLLTTTAMVVVGTLSSIATLVSAAAQPLRVAHGRDRNREFLCQYGSFEVSRRNEADSGSYSGGFQRVAMPILGRGQTVHRIIVKNGSNGYRPKFAVKLRASDSHGLPGKELARGHGISPEMCNEVLVRIHPTVLENGRTYWVEETVPVPNYETNSTYWAIDPKATVNAYMESYYRHSVSSSLQSSSMTPWTKQHKGVYVRLK